MTIKPTRSSCKRFGESHDLSVISDEIIRIIDENGFFGIEVQYYSFITIKLYRIDYKPYKRDTKIFAITVYADRVEMEDLRYIDPDNKHRIFCLNDPRIFNKIKRVIERSTPISWKPGRI